MMTQKEAFTHLDLQEKTEISYVKIKTDTKNLVVCFTSNGTPWFDLKKTLVQLKYNRNDFDILYLRDNQRWYLGGLAGIGKNIEHTLAFLKKEFAKYDKVICVGHSMGGYGSILFGSLCGADNTISTNSQTNLEKLIMECPVDFNDENVLTSIHNLKQRKKECPATWKKYADLSEVLNKNVKYRAYFMSDDFYTTRYVGANQIFERVFHGLYNPDTIKDFPSVELFYTDVVYGNLIHDGGWEALPTISEIAISNLSNILDDVNNDGGNK